MSEQAASSDAVPTAQRRRRTRALVFVGAALGLAVAAAVVIELVRRWRIEADAAVEEIESRLAGLDPVTRAAVVARLTSDEVHRLREADG